MKADRGKPFSSLSGPRQGDESTSSGAYGVFAPQAPTKTQLASMRLSIALSWQFAEARVAEAFKSLRMTNAGWNILLELYICHALQRRSTVTDVCNAALSSQTTALRCIRTLCQGGRAQVEADIVDHRRKFVTLTELGVREVEEVLDAASLSDRRLGLGRRPDIT